MPEACTSGLGKITCSILSSLLSYHNPMINFGSYNTFHLVPLVQPSTTPLGTHLNVNTTFRNFRPRSAFAIFREI